MTDGAGEGAPAPLPLIGPTLAELRLADATAGDVCPSCSMAVCTDDRWCPVCSTPAA
jgi:hypothetical protein